MQGKNPLISIITVVYNGEASIEETILSVLRQKNNLLEYIIIDGGSKDSTVEIIKKYQDQITCWVSERDRGIYDAMNKGIEKAQGSYLYFLNAGDFLVDLPYGELDSCRKEEVGVACFNVKLSDGSIFRSKPGFRLKISNTLHHQGTFYLKEVVQLYDLKYRVFADFDLNQKLFLKQTKMAAFDKVVAYHAMDGISHNIAHFKEVFQIIQKNFGLKYVLVSYLYFKWKGALSWKKKLGF